MKKPSDDEKRFVVLLTALAETFGVPLTEGMLLGYRMGLDGLKVADLETAAREAMKHSERMPKPLELRRLALDAAREAMRTKELPPVETEAEKRRILESWRGREAEVRELVANLPKGHPSRAVADKHISQEAIDRRYQEMQAGTVKS